MNIGIPREIKTREGRVALTPVGVKTLVTNGHKVSIEKSAGADSGIRMQPYSILMMVKTIKGYYGSKMMY
jgi:alanine dehydrogenase